MGFDEINSIEEFKFKVNELSASQEKIRNLHSLENDEYEDKEIKFGRKRKKSKRSRFIIMNKHNTDEMVYDNQIDLKIDSTSHKNKRGKVKDRSCTSASKSRKSDYLIHSRNSNEGSLMDILHK